MYTLENNTIYKDGIEICMMVAKLGHYEKQQEALRELVQCANAMSFHQNTQAASRSA